MAAKKSAKLSKIQLLLLFVKGSKHFFFISIASAFVVSLLDMLTPQVIRVTIDSVIGDAPISLPGFIVRAIDSIGGAAWLKGHLYIPAIAIALIGVLLAVFRYLNQLFNSKGGETMMETMRNTLFSHIQNLPYAWHMKNQTGDIIQRCTSDVDMIRNFIADQLTGIIRIIIMMTMSLYFLFNLNPKLAIVPCCFIPAVVAYSAFFHNRIHKHFTECDENEGILSTIAQENLTGVRVVRAFGRENFERERFEKQNNIYTNLWMKVCGYLSAFWGVGDLTGGLQVMLVVVLGTVACVEGEMLEGEFISFVSYNAMLVWPIRQLGRMISEMSKTGVSIERIQYIINSPAEEDKEDATTPDLHGDIVFDNVSFGYEENVEVLKNVSCTIPEGTVFGILGGTGSGKSTLMCLLNRLYDIAPGHGRILINGVDVADIKARHIRRNVGMVLQEPFLFSRTIFDNISIAREGATMDEVVESTRIACIDDSIREFAKGYDTEVGERGVTLSGGQKQRAAIARMLIQKTPIMVFDDSLSAVDAETDAKIRAALKNSFGKATVILIAHRVTTLMQADKIMVLDKGRIAEIGTHDELMEKNGMYRKVYDMQMSLTEENMEA